MPVTKETWKKPWQRERGMAGNAWQSRAGRVVGRIRRASLLGGPGQTGVRTTLGAEVVSGI